MRVRAADCGAAALVLPALPVSAGRWNYTRLNYSHADAAETDLGSAERPP